MKIVVFSGPGGAGKTTLVNQLFQKKSIRDSFIKGVTVTTRRPREEEQEGRDYFFVSGNEFTRLKNRKFFLESQKVLDNYYGTPKLFYTLARRKKKNLILCIDVKGGLYLKHHLKTGKITTVFIAAPTKQELRRRMKKRAETAGRIKERARLAQEELQAAKKYDYLIVNKDIKKTLKQLEAIIA